MGSRIKNYQSLFELGLNEITRKECLLNLTPEDYSSGPLPDTYGDGEVWIFGTDMECFEIYIKIAIKDAPDGNIALCISFHKADKPLKYPFREGG